MKKMVGYEDDKIELRKSIFGDQEPITWKEIGNIPKIGFMNTSSPTDQPSMLD